MKTIKSMITGIALSTALLCASSVVSAEEWKFAIEEIPGSIMDTYAQAFKQKIEASTRGDITVKIYPLGSLGTPTELVEQVADGIVQFTNVSVGNLGTIVPESQVLMLPYILPSDNKKAASFLSSNPTIYSELGKDFQSRGLQLHTLYSEGDQFRCGNIITQQQFTAECLSLSISYTQLQIQCNAGIAIPATSQLLNIFQAGVKCSGQRQSDRQYRQGHKGCQRL